MKKRFLSLFLALALCMGLAVPAFAAEDKPQRGVLTYTEHIAPQYERARSFTEGLASVRKDGKWGYIDEDNNVVIPFQYDYAWEFSEGYAVVAKAVSTTAPETADYVTYSYYMEAEIGFIDRDNHYTAFTDLYADYDDDWNPVPGPLTIAFYNLVYDDYDGQESFMPGDETWLFHNGFAVIDYHLFRTDGSQVEMTGDDEWGTTYGPTGPVNEGLVPITTLGGMGLNDCGWADTDGNVVKYFLLDDSYPDYDFVDARSFNQGLAPVCIYDYDEEEEREDYLWGLMDRNFRWAIQPQYTDWYVRDFNGAYKVFGETGLASVADANGKWGAINKKGETVIPFQYELLGYVSSGLIMFKQNGKYGYLDVETYQPVIPAQYEVVSNFSSSLGLAAVYDGNKAFVIDKNGNAVPGADSLNPSTYFTLNEDGTYATYSPSTYVVIEKNGKYGYGKIDYLPELPKQGDTTNWAYDEVVEAIEEDLVPNYLQNLYRQNITRAEFCDLIVQAVSEALGKDLETLVLERAGKTLTAIRQEYKFNDTTSSNVTAAYALGIVKGDSDTTFNPYGQITRQEAATMLARAARLLDLKAGTGISFNDAGAFASWAKDEISFVSGLVDPTSNNRVMNGVSSDRFDPASPYTREQAILTILRLFHCAEK